MSKLGRPATRGFGWGMLVLVRAKDITAGYEERGHIQYLCPTCRLLT